MSTKLTLSESNVKVPAYVIVYEKLYAEIMNGDYKPGDQLPPETVLAKDMGISRGSLRQALAILREDGLIYNVQGKGNFINENVGQSTEGLGILDNPIFSCALNEIVETALTFDFQPTAAIVQTKMNLLSCDIALTCNAVYYDCKKPVAHAFYTVPVKYLTSPGLDLNKEEEVKELLSKGIYELASTSSARITLSEAEESIAQYLQVPTNTNLLFIEDVLYNGHGEAIALCKYYLLPQYYQITVPRK